MKTKSTLKLNKNPTHFSRWSMSAEDQREDNTFIAQRFAEKLNSNS